MSDFYLGEIRLLPYDWPPKGWLMCQGQTLPINSNQALFSLLGTTYGGDGINTFQLPDLRGRSIRHAAPDVPLGAKAGQEAVALSPTQMPAHTHALMASAGNGNTSEFSNAFVAAAAETGNPVNVYAAATSPLQALVPAAVGAQGEGQPHENCQPSLVLNYCIAVTGIFPSRN